MAEEKTKHKFGFLNILVLLLSVYILCSLFIDTFWKLDPEISKLLNYIDYFICVVFLYDFFYHLYHAKNRWHFFSREWGWLDLLSSVPLVGVLQVARISRVVRLIRIVRSFNETKKFLDHIFRSRAEGAFMTISIIAVLLLIISSIVILQVEEQAPDSNIRTAKDALWWSYVTLAGVGKAASPVTLTGRIISLILMTYGVGLFGTFTAFIASWFVADNKKNENNEDEK